MKKLLMIVVVLLSFTQMVAQQISHTIQRGETLESIAQKYNVSVEALKKANPNAANIVYVGMKLNIPEIKQKTISLSSQETEKVSDTNTFTPQKEDEINTNSTPSTPSRQGVYIDSGYTDFAVGLFTDKELKFSAYSAFMEFNVYGVMLRTWGSLKSPKTDMIKNKSNFGIGLGYNLRIRLADYAFVDFHPLVYYAHAKWKVMTGTEMQKNKYSKRETYYEAEIWDEKSDDMLGLMLEPKIALQIGTIYLSVGYTWDFAKFKFDKEHKGEAVVFGIGYTLR